jgi:hypothetical protein
MGSVFLTLRERNEKRSNHMLYESLKKSKYFAILLEILGVFLFFYNIIQFHSLSSTALISYISGFALISLANAAILEIEKLRVETIELRKTVEKTEKMINKMLN